MATPYSPLSNLSLYIQNQLARLHTRHAELAAQQKQIEAEIAQLNKMLEATK